MMDYENLSRELGTITAKLEMLLKEIESVSDKLDFVHNNNLMHCERIKDIEKKCESRATTVKWVSAFIVSILGTLIAWYKI